MAKVTKESLEGKIKRLSMQGNPEFGLGLTLNEEYQLEAYKMLLGFMEDEELEMLVERSWEGVERD